MVPLEQSDLQRMTAPERLALISQLWDSLDGDEVHLSSDQRDELDARLETLDRDRQDGTTWEALKAELERSVP